MYCCLEFKLCYLKNLKLFSTRVKELFELICLQKKAKQVFAHFKSFFLRNQSLSNARWFYSKKRKIGKRNLYLNENWLNRNTMWCTTDNHNYMRHICAKGFLDLNFNWAVIDKISNFHKIYPNFTFSQKSCFFKYNWNFLDQLLLPYKFYSRDM